MTWSITSLPPALRNGWALTFGGGIEMPTRTPSTVLYDRPHRQLRRFDRATPATGNPVLLVPPLAVDASCYDLRPGQSLAQFLLDTGRQPYVIDYGRITAADRDLGLEEWIDDIVPSAVAHISADHDGADVDVIGWSLGGIISLLTAADHADLPLGSVTTLGSPMDFGRNILLKPVRMFAKMTGGREITYATHLFGGIPGLFVQAGFRGMSLSRELTRPLFIARNVGDTEALARMEAIDRFIAAMPGYPGRLYRQTYRQLIVANQLARGQVQLADDRVIDLSKLTCRVLLLGSNGDTLAPAATIAPGVEILTGAAEVEFAEVPGLNHLALIAGPQARTTTWPLIDEFLARTLL
ncbi:alpha/beta fold hydrolase [Nocardia goodfellowii]|uniref:Polyhydroxyalkanoate synthase n=1 Tax=Nocardia goodfellowii TaxID=882446 RepID=A0ABS4QRK7_9NOCA|nr:alpha/beta fold hydrolase [Nocardia goodfellowii]MBP2194337.1 polyhydroxyalkanoate synthase [Nocardia goodfellowii]